jgi:hypothetical protein
MSANLLEVTKLSPYLYHLMGANSLLVLRGKLENNNHKTSHPERPAQALTLIFEA